MSRYRGTKELFARPMTRGEYNTYRGWTIPADEDPDEDGYLVEYVEGGEPNDKRHDGYISWSPSIVFETSYNPVDNFLDRMKLEHAELDKRLSDLNDFLASDILVVHETAALLRAQQGAMSDYLAILAQRITKATGDGMKWPADFAGKHEGATATSGD